MNAREIDEAARAVVDANRSRESLADGASAWDPADVTGSSEARLYRAVVSECFLGRSDERQRVSAEHLDR